MNRNLRILAVLFGALLVVALTGTAGAAPPAIPIQQISSDPFTNTDTQHRTQVEPDTFGAPHGTVIAAFQSGRAFSGGGASGIGFARSTDAGQTWTNGHLPGLTVHSPAPGTAPRATDPSVAFSRRHGTWLISSMLITEPRTLVVSRSRSDGLSWLSPRTVAVGNYDKEWIVCDNSVTSGFEGRCYMSWTDLSTGRILTSMSFDAGFNWRAPVASPDVGASGIGAQPVVQPDGTLVIVFFRGTDISAIRSTDGGFTFSNRIQVSALQAHTPVGMRSLPIPSVEVDAAGKIYAVWQDCAFRTNCSANDLVMSTSTNGLTWSAKTRIPIDRVDSGIDHFIPGLAVGPTTSGNAAKLALTYYYFPVAGCTEDTCELNVGFISSSNGGGRWSQETTLNANPMRLFDVANTDKGNMVGDYISTSFVNGTAVGVFSLARVRFRGVFNQAIHAAAVPVN